MKKKTFFVILISTSMIIAVFVGGRLVIAIDINEDGEVLVLREDSSDDTEAPLLRSNFEKVAGIIHSTFLVPIVISFLSAFIFLRCFRVLFVSIIPIRGPPNL